MKEPKPNECRCWRDYPNFDCKERCKYYTCIKKANRTKGRRTKTICIKKENK